MELAGQTASRKQISNSGPAITLTDLWRSIYQCPKREEEFPTISRGKGNDIWHLGILIRLFSCTKCKLLQGGQGVNIVLVLETGTMRQRTVYGNERYQKLPNSAAA